jgi:hypothetical protein
MKLWSALVLAATVAAAQDETKVQDEANGVLAKALEGAKSGLKFKGSTSREQDEMQAQVKIILAGMGRREEPYEGRFTGTVSGDEAHIRIESSDGATDIYRRGDKVVKQQAWTKRRVGVEDFTNEAMALCNLGRLKAALDKAKLTVSEEEKDGKKLKMVKGELPKRLIETPADEEENDPGNPFGQLKIMGLGGGEKLQKIEVKAWIDAESGALTKISYTLTKKSSFGGIRIGGPGFGEEDPGDGDEEKPKKGERRIPGMNQSTEVTYSFEVTESGEGAKVELPKGLERFFTE